MATSSGTRRGAEGRTSVCGGWSHQGRLVPGLTFETYWEERALASLEGSLEEAGVVGTRCAGQADTSGGRRAPRAGKGRAWTEPPRCRVLVPSPQVAHLSVMFDKGGDRAHRQPCHARLSQFSWHFLAPWAWQQVSFPILKAERTSG